MFRALWTEYESIIQITVLSFAHKNSILIQSCRSFLPVFHDDRWMEGWWHKWKQSIRTISIQALGWLPGKVHWSFSSISGVPCTTQEISYIPVVLSPPQNRQKSTCRHWKHCHNIRQDHLFFLWFFWVCLDF